MFCEVEKEKVPMAATVAVCMQENEWIWKILVSSGNGREVRKRGSAEAFSCRMEVQSLDNNISIH